MGCFFCGFVLTISLVAPAWVEEGAARIVRAEVEQRVLDRLDQLDDSLFAGRASVLVSRPEMDMAQARTLLVLQFPQLLEKVKDEVSEMDGACRERSARFVLGRLEVARPSLAETRERLMLHIRSKYFDTIGQLHRELRIFTGANAFVFALLLVALWRKKAAGVHLLPAAMVLLAAAVGCAYLYLFQQDWLHTIVFNDYVGLGYIAYLGVAFLFLSDVLFNEARVTAEVLSRLFEAVGSAAVSPC